MYVAFKTIHPISEVKGSATTGTLSHLCVVLARDTTWLLMKPQASWDFTTPYAHLECAGYGIITYHFKSNKSLSDLKGIEVVARMNSDNDLPGLTEVLLNGTSLGKFQLPAGDTAKTVVRWKAENHKILKFLKTLLYIREKIN